MILVLVHFNDSKEKCGEKNDWELEELENCPNFEEVNKKFKELDF